MALFPEEVIATAENIIGYEFPEQKKHILASALNASGSTKILYGARIETNKRLAIFGDVVLTKTLCVRWIDSGLEVGEYLHIIAGSQDTVLTRFTQVIGLLFVAQLYLRRSSEGLGRKQAWTRRLLRVKVRYVVRLLPSLHPRLSEGHREAL